MSIQTPKVFVSYSWSTPGHYDLIRSYAERLISDGVDVVLDQWELTEGQDKYAFMEKMVTDPSVSHVIIFSDAAYAEKANKRKAGVGTESQIISKKIYDQIDQNKFIPIVCEKRTDGEPALPVFLESRIWIDFSTPESVNENWEKLLRALFGKPIHEKPSLGKPPSYLIRDESRSPLSTIGKYSSIRTALLDAKPSVPICRNDYLDAAMQIADELRIREQPRDSDKFDERVLENLTTLLPLREQLVDWLLIESTLADSENLNAVLLDFLERVLALRYRPAELTSWSDHWFDTHRIFAYEMFLYTVAVLLKTDRPQHIHEILTTHYILPESETSSSRDFTTFDEFNTNSKSLEIRNRRLKSNRLSPIADLIKERATHKDISFRDVMQAEQDHYHPVPQQLAQDAS